MQVVAAWRSLAESASALGRTPLGKILAAALVVRLFGLGWGLPASDGWDDDGVAPRDFLVGVIQTYWPGQHYTYPPLHLLILTVLSAPVWIAGLARSPALDPHTVIHTFIQVPTMTALALVARATSIAMSLGLLWNMAKIGERLGGSARAGVWVAAACAANSALTYYSQTTNLDLPYLFWSVLALRWLVEGVATRQARLLRRVPVFAALAVATKDQAYALFLLGAPLTLGAWGALDPWARTNAVAISRELLVGLLIAVLLLLVVDGALTNPSGFAERLRFLLGSASQDHAYYAKTWQGRERAFVDSITALPHYYPWIFAPIVAAGIAVAGASRDSARRTAGLAPLFVALSFTLAFNVAARRTEHRFVLPQSVIWGLYAGLAFDALERRSARRMAPVFWAVAVPCFAVAIFGCVSVDAAMVLDPRYDAEAWMRDHIREGDTVEVYGNDVHLPRFPAAAALTRVDPSPLETRNPMPGLAEVRDRYSAVDARRPRYIVAPESWLSKYLHPGTPENGYVMSAAERTIATDVDSAEYFRALTEGRTRYRWAHASSWASRLWPRLDIHGSLAREIWIFERVD
jgi:hypothetical protein